MKLVRSNPNAAAATGFGTIGVLLTAGAKALGYELDPTAAVAGAAALTSVGLFIGKNGVRGLLRRVWRGSGK